MGTDRTRERLQVSGVVQGVGFRPFVYRLATGLGVDGFVRNDDEGVVVEVEGAAAAVAELAVRLVDDAPPRAAIGEVRRRVIDTVGESGFRIEPSPPSTARPRTVVPPDIGLCAACEAELFDPTDRRYRHPFITCTDCGPRFTIVESLPYDRPRTTMAGFPMCATCAREYADPGDRRYHAQPLCCRECGLRLWFDRGDGDRIVGDDACLRAAAADLAGGAIVAVKGLGGYHLAVRAADDVAVARLRARKQRGDKPFAVMVRDLETARLVAHVDDLEAAALTGPARPIVLLRRRAGTDHLVAPAVAPGSPLIGVLLPYTGLHHLLLAGGPPALVMTSGNVSEEPIVHRDADAADRLLGPLADSLLGHDRPIRVPCDDSVVRVVAGVELPLRRSRGHAPLPLRLPVPVRPTLAVGGELKSVCALAAGRDVWMSQHLGDMENLVTLDLLDRTVTAMAAFHGIDPEVTVADRHPRYLSRRWAERRDPAVVTVQHHRAHVAAVMAEHGIDPGTCVTGVAFDGSGYGDDGTIWGGELLCGSYSSLVRRGHLRTHRLPGGDAAVRHPSRVAISLLEDAGVELDADLPPVAASGADLHLLRQQLRRGVACVASSSMGRLFDGVASLVGLRHEATFEAQAAMEFEAVAAAWTGTVPTYRFELAPGGVASPDGLVRAIAADVRAGCAVGAMAAGFHEAVADLIVDWAATIGHDLVALSGGVFQNALLTSSAAAKLRTAGHLVLTHRLVPPNDGGLALGQVVLAGALANAGGPR